MALTFLSSEEFYSLYFDTVTEEQVQIGHGSMKRMVEYDFDLVPGMWAKHIQGIRRHHMRATFIDLLYRTFIDFDEDEFVFCVNCFDPSILDDTYDVDGDRVCQDCADNHYSSCNDCGVMVSNNDTYYTLHDESICSCCRENSYSRCDECDGYYHVDYGNDHEHSQGMCCDPVATTFTIRNDGDPVLANDTRATVSLPAGTIDDEGLNRIYQFLSTFGYDAYGYGLPNIAHLGHELDARWQTKEGNFTKRLSRAAHKYDGTKLSPEVVSTVGVIAREHASTGSTFEIEVTRELNLSAEEFYHEDSCWWQSYYSSRCTLKSNGGFALRTFVGTYQVNGRAFIMPMKLIEGYDGKSLTPTFDTMTADAFVVFNGYGDLGGYSATRIISHMAGMTYRKIQYKVNIAGSTEPMYVNSEVGYLVAPEDIAAKYTDGSLLFTLDQHANLHYSESIKKKELVCV